jgi:ParB/RepB/Spo0J family partition protein
VSAVYQDIPLGAIRVSQTSAQTARRAGFDKAALEELAASIKVDGVLQAIVVRPRMTTKGTPAVIMGEYELVAGERRLIAAGRAGLERIPAAVRELTDEQVVRVQLVENLQKENLHPMHEAESYDALLNKHDVSVEQLVAEVGKSKAYIYGRMKLLALSPACRKAFYAGEISASIAEKIARIPTPALQEEALEAVLGNPHAKERWNRREPMSFREAADHINQHFMLDLTQAPFPVEDPKLNGAGPCSKCPKRTGNQPELFDDVKKGDTCTDTACFAAKTRAFGQRRLEQAKVDGTHTIVGGAAKKISPHGVDHYVGEGYSRLDAKIYNGNNHVEVRKLLKPDAAIALLQDPKSGRVVEVVHTSQLKKPKRELESTSSSDTKWKKQRADQAAKAKSETAVRRAVFAALVAKGKWKAPPLRVFADLIAETMDYDVGNALMDALGVPEPKTNGYHDRLVGYVKTLKTDAQLEAFVAQAHLAEELHVNSYAVSPKCPRLEAAAKAARVDVGAIRRELAPKKKPAKSAKSPAKRTGKAA